MKKLVALLMVAVMSLYFAACGGNPKQIASGSCTDTITWTLDSNGLLVISGTGEISDYEKGADNQPWAGYRNDSAGY